MKNFSGTLRRSIVVSALVFTSLFATAQAEDDVTKKFDMSKVNKEKLTGLIQQVADGTLTIEQVRGRALEGRVAAFVMNRLTADQKAKVLAMIKAKKSGDESAKVKCAGLNYPGLWETLELCTP